MGLKVDTRGVEVSEAVFVDKEGVFLFKIEGYEEDGFTGEGAPKFKLKLKGVLQGTKEPIYMHSEMFNLQQNSLWRIKQLEVALKAPEMYDVEDFVGRYVVADVRSRQYEKNGETKTAYGVKSWTYSPLNDKLPPIPESVENTNDVDASDITEDEMPF